jgi:SPP1 gp7 family putative phage head morphogenesis protein
VVTDALTAGGQAAAKQLNKQLRSAAAPKIKGWSFDAKDPKAIEWAKTHTTELIEEMSKATRSAVQALVERSLEGEFDVSDLSDEIADLIGDDARAETIARTETIAASNRGQQEAWDQAVEEGLLTGNETQEWITTPDDRTCPICEPLDGVNVALGEQFDTELGKVDGPPAHPRCRCALALTL